MSRFVLLYQGIGDPSQQEERVLVSAFKAAKVVDWLPGSILVDGDEAEVASVVKKNKNWAFSPERSASVAPPHQRIRRAM